MSAVTFTDKIEDFAAAITSQTMSKHVAELGEKKAQIHLDNSTASIKAGSKYTKVDVGSSGRYMVENATGIIYGVKAYGVINKLHAYGTLDTMQEWNWSGYTACKWANNMAPPAPELKPSSADVVAPEAEVKTIWNSDGTDGPVLICAPPELSLASKEVGDFVMRHLPTSSDEIMDSSDIAQIEEESQRSAALDTTSGKVGAPQPVVKVLAVISSPPQNLPALAIDINKHMEIAAGSALRVGGLLLLAREFHDSADAFLAWADENVGIKKAQAYKLISIHKEFGEDARFNGTAMRVLSMLSGQPAQIIAKAAQLASTGALDTNAAASLTRKTINITPIKTAVLPEPPKVIDIEDAVIVNQPAPAPAESTDDLPWGADVEPGTSAAPAPAELRTDGPLDETHAPKVLVDHIMELEHQVEVLTAQVAELKQPVPSLVQFSSPLGSIVLGLDDVEASTSKSAIRGAYRVLASIWTKETSPEAYELITNAKDELLKAL